MLIGVGVVGYDASTIREAEEIEEDTSKLLLHAERWLNHQEEIEVALRTYLLSETQQSLDVISENRHASSEHIQGLKDALSEHHEYAEEQINGLLKYAEKHQRMIDQIIAYKKAGDVSGAEHLLVSDRSVLFIYGAKLILDNVSKNLRDKRSRYNTQVSLNVLRGKISFALLAFLMICTVWISYFITVRTQRKNDELTAQLEFEAKHDTLTDLPNRRFMHEHLRHAIKLATRHQRRLAFMVVDLDGFKEINDQHGHDAGDKVLKEVARRFKETSRASDLVVRTGGDEFAVIAEEIEPIDSLQRLAQRLIKCLAEPINIPNHSKVSVGCSIGIAVYPDHANNLDALFAVADKFMYIAKTSGKNRWMTPIDTGMP